MAENKVNKFYKDFCVFLKLDNISWPKILVILDNFINGLSRIHPSTRWSKLLDQKGGFKEIWVALELENTTIITLQVRNWNSNWVLEQRQFSFLGQNFLENGQICDRFNGQICDRFNVKHYRHSCRSTRRTNKHENYYNQIKRKQNHN